MGQIINDKTLKTLKLLILAFLFITVRASTASAACGDLNFDGKVDGFDIFIAAQGALGSIPLSTEQAIRADVAVKGKTPDGKIMSNDFVMIREAANGKLQLSCNETPEPEPAKIPSTPTAVFTRLDVVALDIEGAGPRPVVRGQIIISLQPGSDTTALAAQAAKLGASIIAADPQTGFYLVQLPANADAQKAIASLATIPGATAVPNVVFSTLDLTPDDPTFAPGSSEDLRWAFLKTSAPAAWDAALNLPAGPDPIIAVLDTGVDSANTDFAGRILPGADFTGGSSPGADGNGHGTHVAGVIAAAGNNGQGAAGVCWECKILPVKVCDEQGYCPLYSVIQGINFASENGARVINVSFAARAPLSTLPASLLAAATAKAQQNNALVIAAAGNSSADASDIIPAAVPGVIGVTATDRNDKLAAFANYGPAASIAAPGSQIYSLLPGGTAGYKDGTSAAAGFVSGAAGLIISRYPDLTPAEITASLKNGASPATSNHPLGGGRLDISKSLALAKTGGTQPAAPVETIAETPAPAVETPQSTTEPPAQPDSSTQIQSPAQTEPVTQTEPAVQPEQPAQPEAIPETATAPSAETATPAEETPTAPAENGQPAPETPARSDIETAQTESGGVPQTEAPEATGNATPSEAIPAATSTVEISAEPATQTATTSEAIPAAESPAVVSTTPAPEQTNPGPATQTETIESTQPASTETIQTPETATQTTGSEPSTAAAAGSASQTQSESAATATTPPAETATQTQTFAQPETPAAPPAITAPPSETFAQPEPPAPTEQTAADAANFGFRIAANGTACGTDWPQFHCNNNRSGDFSGSFPNSQITKRWEYLVSGDSGIYSSPAVVGNAVYFGTWAGKIIALDAATGTALSGFTTYTAAGAVYSSPAVIGGTLFAGDSTGKIFALNSTTGAQIWATTTSGAINYSSPAVNGANVYIGSMNGYMYALSTATGGVVWAYNTGSAVDTSPAVTSGKVIFGSDNGKIYSLNESNGSLNWVSSAVGAAVKSSPAVANGKIYFGANNNKIYALDETTGAAAAGWATYTAGDIVTSSPVVTGGYVYIASQDGKVYALNDSSGALAWAAPYSINGTYPSQVQSSPAASSATLFIGSTDLTYVIQALNSAPGSFRWGRSVAGSRSYSSPAVANGRVYIGADDSKLYAFETNSSPAASGVTLNKPAYTASGSDTATVSVYVTDPNTLNDIVSVKINLSTIGGSAAAVMYDDGLSSHGDKTSKDGIYSASFTVPTGVVDGPYTLTVTVADSYVTNVTANGSIVLFSNNSAPSVSGCSFSPASVAADGAAPATLSCNVSDADSNVTSVYATMTVIGGASSVTMYDDGSNGDATSGDNVYTISNITAANGVTPATYSITVTAKDLLNVTGTSSASLGVTAPVANVAPVVSYVTFTPPSVAANAVTTTKLTATVTDGNGAGDITSVTADLSAVGGGAAVPLYDDGTNGDATSGDNIYTAANITVAVGIVPATYTINITAVDDDALIGLGAGSINVPAPNVAPSVSACSFSIPGVAADGVTTTTLSCTVTDSNGNLNASAIYANLSSIGGGASTTLTLLSGNTYQKTGVTVAVGVAANTYPIIVTASDSGSPVLSATSSANIIVLSSTTTNGSTCGTSWPQFHCNDHLSAEGVTTFNFPLVKKWEYSTGGAVDSSPALDNGYVYVGSSNGNVYALNQSDGTVLWSRSVGGSVTTAPSVYSGKVYVGLSSGLTVLDAANGNPSWSATTSSQVNSPVVSSTANAVFFTAANGYVYSYNFSGTQLWKSYATGSISAPPAYADGKVYVGTLGKKVACFDATTGALAWQYTATGNIDQAPTVGEGKVFVGTTDSKIIAFPENSSTPAWTLTTLGAAVTSSPAIAGGVIYYTAANKKVFAHNVNTNTPVWSVTLPAVANSSIAAANGKLFLGAIDNNLYVLNSSNGTTAASYLTGGYVNSSPAAANNKLAFGSKDGKVYLYESFATPTVSSVTLAPAYISTSGSSSTKITAAISDGNGLSDIASVTVNLTAIGGTATNTMYDDATHGDSVSGDGTYTLSGVTCSGGGCAAGTQTLTVTVTDKQAATASGAASLMVNAAPAISGCSWSPSAIAINGSATATLTCTNITDANSNISTVTANLSSFLTGGSATALSFVSGTTWKTAAITPTTTTASGTKTITITVTDTGGATGTATATLTLTDPAPVVSACSFTPNSIHANAVALTTLQCTVTDGNNNVSSVKANLSGIYGNASYSLTNNPAGSSVWKDSGISAGASTTVPATYTIIVTATDASGGSGTSSAQIYITDPGPSANCSFTPSSIPADGVTTTKLSCIVVDANYNLSSTSPVTVNLLPLGGAASVTVPFSSWVIYETNITAAATTPMTTYYGITVTLMENTGRTTTALVTSGLTITGAAPSISNCSFSPSSIQAQGRDATTLTCKATDSNNDIWRVYADLTPIASGSIALLSNNPAGSSTWTLAGITAATGTVLRDYSIQAVVEDNTHQFGGIYPSLRVADPKPVVQGCSYTPSTIVSDGSDSTKLKCTVIDANNNANTVVVDLTGVGGSAAAPLTYTGASNLWQSASLTAAVLSSPGVYTVPGPHSTTVTASDLATSPLGTGTNTASLTTTDPKPAISACSFSPSSVDANNASSTTITCTATDLSNNITSVKVNLSSIGGNSAASLVNATGTTSWSLSGITVATTTPIAATSAVVTVTDAYSGSATTSATVTVTDPKPVVSNCSFSPSTVPADNTTTTTLTCTVTDANNNLNSGSISVNLAAIGGSSSASLSTAGGNLFSRSGVTAATGTALMATNTFTVSASDFATSPGTGTNTASLVVTDVPPTVSSCSFSPNSIPANNTTAATLSCAVTDINNDLSTVKANLTSIGGSATQSLSNTPAGSATWTVSVKAGTATPVPATYTITITGTDVSGAAGTSTAQLNVTDPAPSGNCSFSPNSIPADGVTSSTLSCLVIDANNNLSATSPVTVDLFLINGGVHTSTLVPFSSGVTFKNTAITATPTATINVTHTTIPVTITETTGRATGLVVSSGLTITGAPPKISNCSFSPNSVQAQGRDTTTLTCTASDVNNNLFSVYAILTPIGGAALAAMTNNPPGGATYTLSGITIATGTTLGSKTIFAVAQDSSTPANLAVSTSTTLIAADPKPIVDGCWFTPSSISSNGSDSTTLKCTVIDANGVTPPTLTVGANLSSFGGSATATLTYSGSSNIWQKTGVTAPAQMAPPAYTAPGSYSSIVTATDTAGGSGTNSVSLTLTPPKPVVSACSFSPATIVANGTAISTLQCSVTDANNDLNTVTADLSSIGGLAAASLVNSGGGIWKSAAAGVSVPLGYTPATATIVVTATDLLLGAGTSSAFLGYTDPTPVVSGCFISPLTSIKADGGSTKTDIFCTGTDPTNNISQLTASLSPLTRSGASTFTRIGTTSTYQLSNVYAPGSATAPATYTIVITATDAYSGTGTSSVSIPVTDPPPSVTNCLFTPSSAQANGLTTSNLACDVTDPNNNILSVTADLSSIGSSATAALTLSGSQYVKTAILIPTTASLGPRTMTVTATDKGANTATGSASLTVTDPLPVVASCSFSPSSFDANAVATSTLTCVVTDVNNNVSTVKADLSSIMGASAAAKALTLTATNTWTLTGVTAATSTTGVPKAISILVTATDASSGTGSNTATATVTDPKPVISSCSFSNSVAANASDTTTVQCSVSDANNNLNTVTINLTPLNWASATYSAIPLTLTSGVWKASNIQANIGAAVATATLTITATDLTGGTGTITAQLKVTDPPPTISSCAFSPVGIMADGVETSTLQCTVNDYTNNVSTVIANLSSLGGSTSAPLTNTPLGSTTWIRSGVTIATTVPPVNQTVGVTAIDSFSGSGSASATIKVGDPPPVVSACSFSPSSRDADGAATSTLQCTVTDKNNNLDTVTADLTALGGGATDSLADYGSGTWKKTNLTISTASATGTKTITITATDDSSSTGTATSSITVTDPKPVVSGCTFTPSSIDADGETTTTLKCTVTDANNNIASVTTDLSLIGVSGLTTLAKSTGNYYQKTVIAVATSTAIASKTFTVTASDFSSGSGTSSVSLGVTDPKPVISACSFSPNSVPADATTTTTLQCTAKDANGNLQNVTADLRSIGGSATATLTDTGANNIWNIATLTVPVGSALGTFSLFMTATDAASGSATAATSITVTDPPPQVSNCSFIPNIIPSNFVASTTLSCTVTDLSNNITSVTVNLVPINGGPAETLSFASGATWQRTYITSGGTIPTSTHALLITAIDAKGGVATSTGDVSVINPVPAVSSCSFIPNKIAADGFTTTTLRCTVIDESGHDDIDTVTADLSSIGGAASAPFAYTDSNIYTITDFLPALGEASGTKIITITATDKSRMGGTATAALGIVPTPPLLVYKQSCAMPPAGRWLSHSLPGMLNAPLDATVNTANGDFIVADTGNNRISVFDSSCGFVRAFGSIGGGNGQFQAPRNIVFNTSNSYIYVVDSYNRVQYFQADGTFVNSWVVQNPISIAVDGSGTIYVGTLSGQIIKYSSTGTLITQWSSPKPIGIDVDAAGSTLFITDQTSNTILTLDTASGATQTIVLPGSAQGKVSTPWGISYNEAFAAVAVADYGNNRVQRFNGGGAFVQKFDTYGAGVGMINYPKGVASISSGGLLIVDTLNNRISQYSPAP